MWPEESAPARPTDTVGHVGDHELTLGQWVVTGLVWLILLLVNLAMWWVFVVMLTPL